MKVAVYFAALVASASAFVPQTMNEVRTGSVSVAASRREAIAAAAAAFLPVAANAAVGESPKFSVFGVFGDGSALSEGAAYGTDQSAKVFSPYSVYSEAGPGSVYQPSSADDDRKKAILAETKNRLAKIPGYVSEKKWSEVRGELSRYMYETRGAVRGLTTTTEQAAKAKTFFDAIEATDLAAALKKSEDAAASADASIKSFDEFVASL